MVTSETTIVLSDSEESDSDEIFCGPITKREICKLKYFNLPNNKELLDLFEKMEDNDVVNDSLIKYYKEVFPQRSTEKLVLSKLSEHCSPENSMDNLTSSLPDFEEELLYETISTESDSSAKNKDISENIAKRNEDVCLEENMSKNSKISQEDIENGLECSIVIHNNSLTIESDIQNDLIEEQENVSIYDDSAGNLDFSGKSENKKYNSSNSTPNKSDCSLSHTNDQISFNCTLEEMELLMKYGENYMNESSDHSISAKNKSKHSDENYESEKENCSYNSLHSSKNLSPPISSQEKNITSAPRLFKQSGNIEKEIKTVKYGKNYNTLHTPEVPSRFRTSAADSSFKMPVKIPSAKKSLTYKNIRSPIALYINNSPKVPLVKNVSKRTIQASTFKEVDKNYCEKLEDLSLQPKPLFPVKTYKPATKTVLLSKENESPIPNNVRKLIKGPLNPEIIKHLGRVNETPEKYVQVSSNYVRHDDMTILSSSTVEADVSVHISKNAVRTNCLQNTNL